MVLVKRVYQITAEFPKHELFGLTSQLCRSAVSIPSNIAEGNGRSTTPDYIRFLQIARGSLFETQTQIEIAAQLEFIHPAQNQELESLANEIERMRNTIMTILSRQSEKG